MSDTEIGNEQERPELPEQLPAAVLAQTYHETDFRVVALSQAVTYMENQPAFMPAPAVRSAAPDPHAGSLRGRVVPSSMPARATPGEHLAWGLERTLAVASRFLHWLQAGGTPVRLVLAATITDGYGFPVTTQPKGIIGMAQITDAQKIQLTATPEDAAGFPTDSAVAFTLAGSGVVELDPFTNDDGSVAQDSVWVTALAPGSDVVTVSVDTGVAGADPLTATFAVDVVPGGVATIQIVAGDPVAK